MRARRCGLLVFVLGLACREPGPASIDTGAQEPAAAVTPPSTPTQAAVTAPSPVPAPPVVVELPDTPAGAFARGLLAVVEGGDEAALRAYVDARLSAKARTMGPLDEWVTYFRGLGGASGGVDVVRVEPHAGDTDALLIFYVRARRADRSACVMITVDERGALLDANIQRVGDPLEHEREQLPKVEMDEARLVREIAGRVERLAAADLFSGVVLVAHGDRVLLHVAHGQAERSFAAANRPDTKFNLGSMNKMFTSIAVAQLVEQGKLTFDTPLAAVVPDYPDQALARKATIHHLLTHTSGIGGTIFAPEMYEHRERYKTPSEYLPLFARVAPDFPPGERFAYANAGFMVLGLVIERVSGESYDAYMQRHVFDPAGMTGTRAYAWDEPTPNLAVGYMRQIDDPFGFLPRRTNVSTLPYAGTPAGGGYSTAPDLLAFVQALRGGRLLGAATTETVLTPRVAAPMAGPGAQYGYGFFRQTVTGRSWFGHHGGAPGINSALAAFADGSYTLIVLGNYDFPNASAVTTEVLGLLAAQPPA